MTKALAIFALLAASAIGVQSWRLNAEQAAHEQTRASYAAYREEMARRSAAAAQAQQMETDRRLRELQEVIDEAKKREAAARGDAAAAADTGRRLRQQLAALTASCRAASADTNTAPAGPSAESTERLLADVQRRLGEATERIAGFADAAHGAGLTCERAYDALEPRP
jgi:chromosome segregation ATPase